MEYIGGMNHRYGQYVFSYYKYIRLIRTHRVHKVQNLWEELSLFKGLVSEVYDKLRITSKMSDSIQG